jgi:hypothetical protein
VKAAALAAQAVAADMAEAAGVVEEDTGAVGAAAAVAAEVIAETAEDMAADVIVN